MLFACRNDAKVAPPPAPEAAATDAAAEAAATRVAAPRPLPAPARIRAVFEGTDAYGIVAIGGDGQRSIMAIPAGEANADKPVLVASFTKLWVAVAILRLAARKELALDDEIETLVPELRSKPWSDSTVRDLLSHTSRVPELGRGFFTRTDIDFSRPAAVLAKEVSAATEKRGNWKYRNSEYAILGAILEAKGGRAAGAVLAKEVFTPAGMKHAGIVVHDRPADVDFAPMGRVRPENFFTAGDGYASANDLLSFFEALEGDTLLDAESKAALFAGSPKHDRAALGCWAYPYATGDGGTTLLVERPGSFGNVKLVTVFYPEQRRTIVFWTSDPLDVGKPRTKDSIASKLAHVALE